MKKALPSIFSHILALFLAIVLFGGSMCAFAAKTICDPQLLINDGLTSGCMDELYEEIKYKWENLLSVTGILDPDPIMQVLTPEAVKESALAYLQDSYSGTATIDTQALHDALEEKVRDYANSNNIHATPQKELDQNIADLVSACIQEYTSAIKIPLLPKLLGKVSKLPHYLKMGFIACAVCAVLLLAFIFFLQKKRADTLYYASASTIANTVLLMGSVWLANIYQLTDRLPIAQSALRTLVVAYVNTLLGRLWQFGKLFLYAVLILLLMYALAILVTAIFKRKKRQPKYLREETA